MRCGDVWSGVASNGIARLGLVRFDLVRHGMDSFEPEKKLQCECRDGLLFFRNVKTGVTTVWACPCPLGIPHSEPKFSSKDKDHEYPIPGLPIYRRKDEAFHIEKTLPSSDKEDE